MFKNKKVHNMLALGAVVGPAAFFLGWLILEMTQPGYSPIKEEISNLALGRNGWIMNVLFMLNGLLTGIGVVGIIRSMRTNVSTKHRRTIAIWLAFSPIGTFWDGVFNVSNLTLHNIGAQLAVALPIIGFIIVALRLRQAPEWRAIGNWLLLAGPLTLILLVLFITSIPLDVLRAGGSGGNLGLLERILACEIQFWYVLLGWKAYRSSK